MGARSATGAFGEGRSFSSVRGSERVALLDALRGVAILGILVVNLEFFRTYELWDGYPVGYEGPLGAFEHAYLFLANFLAYGKFITALAFLFGLGLALQYRRALAGAGGARAARRFLLRRLVMLALFGAAHAALVWSGDVLLFYALLGLPFSLLFVHRRPRTLVVWALCILGSLCLLGLVLAAVSLLGSAGSGGSGGAADPSPSAAAYAAAYAGPSDFAQRAEEAYTGGSYADQVRQRLREYSSIFRYALLTSGPQVFSMMLLGAAFANAGWVGDRDNLRRRARRAALFGLAVGAPLNLFYAASFEVGPQGAEWWSFYLRETVRFVGAPIMAVGWMGLVASLFVRFPRRFGRLSDVGRMALTNYLAQSVIMTGVFYGFGLYGKASAGLAVALMAGVWTLELLWSRPWLSRFSYGPAEWLWRRLSYGDRFETKKAVR